MNRRIFWAIVILFFALFSGTQMSYAKISTDKADVALEQYEHIINFNSDITINKDSSLNVIETIKVYANNEQINHGIYRDFPTIYKDDYGNKYKIDFTIISIKNNGQAESYEVKNISNGVRIYIGNANTIIPPGVYNYEISYNVTKELGFFEKEDVLYWNVTGNGWSFSIDTAEATVHLPDGVPFNKVSTSAYTGYKGVKGQDFYSTTTDNYIYFGTTDKLQASQGLTIAVGWPKGHVKEPTEQEKFQSILSDNIGIIVGTISLIIILLYYLITWLMFGRDPRKGAIIAEYDSPNKLSPAEVRFNFIEGYDNDTFTSAIISMAVKGCLKIDKTASHYKLIKTGKNQEKLSDEETIAHDIIFASNDEVSVGQTNFKKFKDAQLAVNKSLEKKFVGSYFVSNKKIFIAGIVLSVILFIITSIFSDTNYPIYIFMSFWLSLWSIGTFAFTYSAIIELKTGKASGIIQLIFALPFIVGEIVGISFLIYSSSIFFVLLLIVFIVINILFFKVIKRRTHIGRELEDKIEGFKMFLSVTEEDRLNFANPPEKTPELFEKFLPYALALGVGQQWSEQFSTIFNMSDENLSYHPGWYTSSHKSSFETLGDFTKTVGASLSGQISSSSHAPGSSSSGGSFSSHGGGSSGGGGGGGGGGGW